MLQERRLDRRLEASVAAPDHDNIVSVLKAGEPGHLVEQPAKGFDASPAGPGRFAFRGDGKS
jgi:hypothetical protein